MLDTRLDLKIKQKQKKTGVLPASAGLDALRFSFSKNCRIIPVPSCSWTRQ
jgi:hypothetical protein